MGALLALAVGVMQLLVASVLAIAIYALIPAPIAAVPPPPRVVFRMSPLVLPCEEGREIRKVRERMEKVKARKT